MTGADNGEVEQAIFEKIASYLSERMGVNYTELCRSIDIAHDIGMTGDDAVEFLEWYDREFLIRKGSLDFINHFDSEAGFWPSGLVMPFVRIFFPKWRKMPLTIESLIQLAVQSRSY